jgi:hypothetical protein
MKITLIMHFLVAISAPKVHYFFKWTTPPQGSGVSIKAMKRRKRRGINPRPPLAD